MAETGRFKWNLHIIYPKSHHDELPLNHYDIFALWNQ